MPWSRIFIVANMSFNAICENKILTKISEFTVTHLVSFGMMKHTGPKFFNPLGYLKIKVADFEFFMLNFCIKVFKTLLFAIPTIDLVHV